VTIFNYTYSQSVYVLDSVLNVQKYNGEWTGGLDVGFAL
jgi:hypothetical protein